MKYRVENDTAAGHATNPGVSFFQSPSSINKHPLPHNEKSGCLAEDWRNLLTEKQGEPKLFDSHKPLLRSGYY